jgi:hypothetical protein
MPGPYATYDVTEVVSAAAQTEINGKIDLLIALIGNDAANGGFPDGDDISPQMKAQLVEELGHLQTGIDAAPTS